MSAIAGILTVGGLGAAFAGIGGYQLVRGRKLRGDGVRTSGRVVTQAAGFSPGGAGTAGGYLPRPVIAFTTRDGQRMQVTSNAASNESSFVPGARVTIYYDPADPNRYSIPDQQAGIYRIFLAIGSLLLVGLLAYAVFGPALLVKLLFGIPLLLGAVFGGIGWFGIRRTWRIKHGGRVDGLVVGASQSESRNGITLNHPVVRYAVPGAGMIDAPSIRGHMGKPPPLGVRVRVCYDAADPHRMLLSYDDTPAVFWIFGVIGVIVFAVGVVVLAAVAANA